MKIYMGNSKVRLPRLMTLPQTTVSRQERYMLLSPALSSARKKTTKSTPVIVRRRMILQLDQGYCKLSTNQTVIGNSVARPLQSIFRPW
jgi:hypothetical protein